MPNPLNMKTEHAADKAQEWTTEGRALPKAREGWVVQHPTTWKIVEVVTREDYDFLFKQANASIAVRQQHIDNLDKALAAEREKREHWEKVVELMRGQLAAAQAAIEQKRLEIWADSPNQPDVQESVIAKLDLVHRHAIFAAQQPLVELLKRCQEAVGRSWTILHKDIKEALAKVKEGK